MIENRQAHFTKEPRRNFGFAQSVRVYGENWRAGMIYFYRVCGQRRAAQGLLEVEKTAVPMRRKRLTGAERKKPTDVGAVPSFKICRVIPATVAASMF